MAYTIDRLVTHGDEGPAGTAQRAWSQWCSDVHGQLEMTFAGNKFRGRVVRQATDGYAITAWTCDAEQIKRGSRCIRADPRGTYEVLVPIREQLFIGRDDADLPLEPGEIALVPTDSPLAFAHHDATSGLSLMVPVERIDQRVGRAEGGATCRISSNPLAAIASELLLSTYRRREELTAAAFDAVCDRAIDLVCLAMNGEVEPPGADGAATVVARVRRHVRAHATDPDLTLGDVAKAVGWSTRYVQAALAKDGLSVRTLIRQERLALARSRLADPMLRDRTIEWVAHTVGFTSASAFSKAYRREFGMTPGDTRSAGRAADE